MAIVEESGRPNYLQSLKEDATKCSMASQQFYLRTLSNFPLPEWRHPTEGYQEALTTSYIDTSKQKSGWELGKKWRRKIYGICGSPPTGVHAPSFPKPRRCCHFCLSRRTVPNVSTYQPFSTKEEVEALAHTNVRKAPRYDLISMKVLKALPN